jgi:sugar lactone lactonase YvrE
LGTKTQESQIIHIGGLTSIVIPVGYKREEFIITQSNKLFKFNWVTKEKQLLAEVEKSIAGNRFNNGKCDSKGRLWIGTLGLETYPGVVDPTKV